MPEWRPAARADPPWAVPVYFVGDSRSRTYNKTAAMFDRLSQLSPLCHFFELAVPLHATGVRRRWLQLRTFAKLYSYLAARQHPSGTLWLSEFNFTPITTLVCWLLARRFGMRLVSGPHNLRWDSRMLLSEQGTPRTGLLPRWMRRALDNLLDRLSIASLDAVHSYSAPYLERIQGVANARDKDSIVFPIGVPLAMLGMPKPSRAAGARQKIPLRIVFWGMPSIFHGIELLPDIVRILSDSNIPATVTLFCPPSPRISHILSRAAELSVSKAFSIDHETRISGDYARLNQFDVGVSHLIGPNLPEEAREMCDAMFTTNKLSEALALQLPVLGARTRALGIMENHPGVLLCEPADPASAAAALRWLARD
jgi:hypothetical protein